MAGAGIMSLRLPPATGGPACTVRCGARTRAVRSHRVVQGARVGAHQLTCGPNQLKWKLRARTRAVSVTAAVPEPGPEEVELEDMCLETGKRLLFELRSKARMDDVVAKAAAYLDAR